MRILIKTSEYILKYLIKQQFDIYDPEIHQKLRLGYQYQRRTNFTTDRKGNPIPNPYFQPFEKYLIPFNLCYLLYQENTEPDPPDSDFDIGFHLAEINFEENLSQIMKKYGYRQYFMINHKFSTKKPETYTQNNFDGFVFTKQTLKPLLNQDLDLDCSNLQAILKMLSLDAVLIMKAQYFANYNYVIYFQDDFSIESLLDAIKSRSM
ncbi:MAG: hypothetical protein K2H89_12395 [Oscillospiraceae bacterium]|nr:hypothetical protein [Oscillospiraceae bacterium]